MSGSVHTGTEVVFRWCLNEVVLSGHVVTLWACAAEQWEWVSEALIALKPPQNSTTTKEAVKEVDDSDHTDSHVEHVHGNY